MAVQVDVCVACDEDGIPDSGSIGKWVTRAIEAVGAVAESEVSVRIVDVSEIQNLNRDFRRIDKPTNVLSFPAGKIDGFPTGEETPPLGDVVLCAQVVREESRQQGKAVGDHWAHLLVHGTLHLLGFEHQSDEQAREMECLESQILTTNGVADPYGVADPHGESPQET